MVINTGLGEEQTRGWVTAQLLRGQDEAGLVSGPRSLRTLEARVRGLDYILTRCFINSSPCSPKPKARGPRWWG